ncbi:MAG: nucleotidyltransferase family protein [Gemmatimonadales bacterium]
MHPARLLLDTLRFHGAPPPEQLAAAWAEVDVRGLERLVTMEGCAIWLYRRLRQLSALETLDQEFATWVAARAREYTARNLLVEAEAQTLARSFHELGTPFVLMKGVARRLTVDRYPLADARVTNDVDVLVPANRAWEAWHALRLMGYERTTPWMPPRPEHHHLPALWNERQVGVEVHTTNAPNVPPAEAWRRHYESGMDVERDGVRYRVPSATELFWSGTAHSLRLPDIAYLLILMFDAAVIWASGAAVDWVEIRRRIEAGEIVDRVAAGAWLGAAASIAGVEPPEELAGRIAPYDVECALRLRLAVLRHVAVPASLRKAVLWWTSERARQAL